MIRVIRVHSSTWTTILATGFSIDVPNVRQYHVLPFISRPRDCLALHESNAAADYVEPPRRHSDEEFRPVRSAQPFRTTFAGAVTAALAVARFKLRLAKRINHVEAEVAGGEDDVATLTAPASVPRPPCSGCYCAYALSNGPLAV